LLLEKEKGNEAVVIDNFYGRSDKAFLALTPQVEQPGTTIPLAPFATGGGLSTNVSNL
jgi:hypothetical protein